MSDIINTDKNGLTGEQSHTLTHLEGSLLGTEFGSVNAAVPRHASCLFKGRVATGVFHETVPVKLPFLG